MYGNQEINILVNGKMVNNMEKAKKHGKVEQHSLVSLRMERDFLELLLGQVGTSITVNTKTLKDMVKVFLHGLLEISLLENLKVVKDMDKVLLHG